MLLYTATVTQCWIDMRPMEWQAYMTIISIALFIIPAFIIAICYTIMVHTIWTQSRILTPTVKKSSSKFFSFPTKSFKTVQWSH